jgi:hypothetical protein
MQYLHSTRAVATATLICGLFWLTSAVGADVGKAIAGAAVASVASEVCPGYSLGITPALRLAAAGINASDLKPGGKHYDIMKTGLAIMTAQHRRNAAEFCAYAFRIRNDVD